MAIVSLGANDSGSVSRGVINDNFTDLDTTKADLASPTFTGTPTLPTGTIAVTQSANDNSTKLATTAYVDTAAQPTVFPNSSAFSGTSPTSYTDLDLSSIVGARSSVVLLKVVAGTITVAFHFRKNGETAADHTVDASSHASRTGLLETTDAGYVIVVTDSAGVVEWFTTQGGVGQSSTTCTITVEAYW